MSSCVTAVKSVILNNPLKVEIIDQAIYVTTELYKTGLSANMQHSKNDFKWENKLKTYIKPRKYNEIYRDKGSRKLIFM